MKICRGYLPIGCVRWIDITASAPNGCVCKIYTTAGVSYGCAPSIYFTFSVPNCCVDTQTQLSCIQLKH